MSKEKLIFFITNSDSTLQVCMKFAFIVTFLVFLDSEWITDNVSKGDNFSCFPRLWEKIVDPDKHVEAIKL